MEPYVHLRITLGEEHLGRVVKDLTENSGEIVDLGSQSSEAINEDEGIPYSSDGVYLPPEWMSPSAFSETPSIDLRLCVRNMRRRFIIPNQRPRPLR